MNLIATQLAKSKTPQRKRQRSILTRKRFQFAGALMVAAILPYLVRAAGPPPLFAPAATNALVANVVAVTLAFWIRLSVETYPGTRRSAVILPSSLAAHGMVVVWFLLTRLPYDRVALIASVLLHVLWLYVLYLAAEWRVSSRIAVVPFGDVARLTLVDGVDWVILSRPLLQTTKNCDAIVADFSADLPAEWKTFLSDAALAGRIVYQHKQLAESLTGRVELEHLSENNFGFLVPARAYFYLKMIFDFAFAVMLLPLVLPVMAVVAIAITIDDGRPILFKQTRLGHAGRHFTAYKFRTMRHGPTSPPNADVRAALATAEGDPRITRVGAVLRRYRLDELPQMFNILKGQMSWIGPRPEPEILTRWFQTEIPFYRYRHVVKPGISGWAQVNQGYVSGVDGIHEKLRYDFYYIKNFSPWLDLLVFFRTIKTMITGFGSK